MQAYSYINWARRHLKNPKHKRRVFLMAEGAMPTAWHRVEIRKAERYFCLSKLLCERQKSRARPAGKIRQDFYRKANPPSPFVFATLRRNFYCFLYIQHKHTSLIIFSEDERRAVVKRRRTPISSLIYLVDCFLSKQQPPRHKERGLFYFKLLNSFIKNRTLQN